MASYNIFLLDDEPVFLETFGKALQKHLDTLPQEFNVQAFTTFADFEAALAETQPDLIISDISLPNERQTGISFLRGVRKRGCKAEIIFLTGFLNYVVDIFELRPLYFIMKDEYEQRLPRAMELFLETQENRPTNLSLVIDHTTEIIPTDNILYMERVRRKTFVVCTDQTYVSTAQLTELAEQLPVGRFVFAHQSVLVNMKHVRGFTGRLIVMDNGSTLPISRARADEFRQAMATYLEG